MKSDVELVYDRIGTMSIFIPSAKKRMDDRFNMKRERLSLQQER